MNKIDELLEAISSMDGNISRCMLIPHNEDLINLVIDRARKIKKLDKQYATVATVGTNSASEFLQKAKDLLDQRGKDYDTEEGERSMAKTIEAFNIITYNSIKESEGWLLIQLLKDVRQWSKTDYHADSAEDCISYSALKAEALSRGN